MTDDVDTVLDKLRSATWETNSVAEAELDIILSNTYTSVMSVALLHLLRKLDSYEHVLHHVAEDSEWHKPAACVDCQRMAAAVLKDLTPSHEEYTLIP